MQKVVEEFIREYNENWLLEKLNYKSPLEARKEWIESNSTLLADREENTATTLDDEVVAGVRC